MPEKRVVVWVQNMGRTYLMLQWHDPATGKRKSRSAETNNPLEAERKRADLEYELNNGLFREASRMSWERFRELYEAEYLPARRANTQRNHRATLDLFGRLCNPASLRSVTQRTVSAFAAAMRSKDLPGRRKGMQASSVKTHLRTLRTVLRWAAAQQLLPAVPDFPKVSPPRKKPQPVPGESFEKLLDKAPDDHMRAYLLAGWLAGLRLSEAFELEWEPSEKHPYLDLGRGRVVLPAEFAKSVEDQWVPLDPKLKAALLALPPRGRKVFHFIDRRSGRPVSAGSVSKRVALLARAAGVKLTMHTLRKGFGCRYAARVPAQVLQRLMRHASVTTTMAFYANVDEAVEEAVFGPGRNTGRNTADSTGPESASTPPAPEGGAGGGSTDANGQGVKS